MQWPQQQKSVWWMAFLQGKRYMFNMVVLNLHLLHSSKYSINTVYKPSHYVSLFSASGIFVAIWYQCVSASGILNGQKKKIKIKIPNLTSYLTPETRQRNTTHQIWRTRVDLPSLNNGTDWKIVSNLKTTSSLRRIQYTWPAKPLKSRMEATQTCHTFRFEERVVALTESCVSELFIHV